MELSQSKTKSRHTSTGLNISFIQGCENKVKVSMRVYYLLKSYVTQHSSLVTMSNA